MHLQSFAITRLIIIYLFSLFLELFPVNSLTPPDAEDEDCEFDHSGEIESPLDIALHKMEEIRGMFLNPLTKFIVIVS
jgi:hypothetical protein